MQTIFTDGECPLCQSFQLHLNEDDFLECPNCNLVYSAANPLAATIMPKLGNGRFRIEDSQVHHFSGAIVTQNIKNTCLPDFQKIFRKINDLHIYRENIITPQPTIKSKSLNLSSNFLRGFQEQITQIDKYLLKNSWPSKSSRTALYANIIIPEIAKSLELIHRKERFTVDHALLKVSSNEYEVPHIYIESENNFTDATHEIRKLCSLNSPARILITATTKELLPYPSTGAYEKLREWQGILKAHHEENYQFNGTLTIIIGRITNEKLIFNSCAFHPDGALALPMSILVERNLY